jgi:shikimate kinase
MISVSVTGAPEDVCKFLESLLLSGNEINKVTKLKNNSTYIVIYSPSTIASSYLVMEDGSFLLLENGDKIILE